MNAIEIEEAFQSWLSSLSIPSSFPMRFWKPSATRIRPSTGSGGEHQSDRVAGRSFSATTSTSRFAVKGKCCDAVELKSCPATARQKAKFILATDGEKFEAEDLSNGETVACAYADFPDHFGFFLPLAGITTVKQIRESSFDIRATSRLNRLYVELLKENPEWGTAERRQDMNHFMARLIFCFFAEDTDIFNGKRLFTATIEQMSARDSSNTHEVMADCSAP